MRMIKRILLCCVLLIFIFMLSSCDEYTENLMPEYPEKIEYQAETDLPLSESNPRLYEFLQEIDIDFMERRESSIERIVIVTFPYLRMMYDSIEFKAQTRTLPEFRMQTRRFYITERFEIEYVYSILNETRAIYINEHPYQWQAWTEGMEVFIDIEYANGEVSEIQSHSIEHNTIGRFLDTVGNHNDPGYILGINERIWEFIDNLSND